MHIIEEEKDFYFMSDRLYQYLKNEWRINNLPKYQKYFEGWVNNLTDTQIYYYNKLWLR